MCPKQCRPNPQPAGASRSESAARQRRRGVGIETRLKSMLRRPKPQEIRVITDLACSATPSALCCIAAMSIDSLSACAQPKPSDPP